MQQESRRSPGRPKKNPQLDQQTSLLILRTAAASFMEFGYEKVSLDHIAKQCGVTKATVYYYYANKANLFTESVVTMFRNITQHVTRYLTQPKPLKERLLDIAAVQMGNEYGEFETLMKEASSHLSAEQIERIRQGEVSVHHVMIEGFQEGIKTGDLADYDPMLLSLAFASMLMMGNRELMMQQYDNHQDAAQAIVELFWNGAGK
ncbi:TetR/AcrR family transcriptional regulator [Marinicrinis sediminis]